MTSERPTCTGLRWLSIVGIGEDGVQGLSPVAQKVIASAEPDRRGAAGDREASRPASRRAGERRSLPLRRRRPAAAWYSGRRDALPAATLVFQPGGGAARL